MILFNPNFPLIFIFTFQCVSIKVLSFNSFKSSNSFFTFQCVSIKVV
ncbi:hypothetical protein HMPREF3206_01020 [Fusobacterium equinum]|uniref:Uncharacterized protein n=1 Tax=Fusobacterium equinum TaxID=134605 RepID=A0A133NDH1_9FUSO|nr:hypothetical protein HMPREF3206_01020 [Fusobacterium equinum]